MHAHLRIQVSAKPQTPLFVMVTFGSKKASHGHYLGDEVGWHLIFVSSDFVIF
jgi:hypothetical protein